MGEFDDVLALGPGEGWDEWDNWAVEATEQRTSLLSVPNVRLDLAGLVVELRGDIDDLVLDLLAPLSVDTGGVVESAVRITFAKDGDTTIITGPDQTELLRSSPGDDLIESVHEVLFDVLDTGWPSVLALRAACVELDSPTGPLGVLVSCTDLSVQSRVVTELLSSGARLVAADRTVLRPGTRTVIGLSGPDSPAAVPRDDPDGPGGQPHADLRRPGRSDNWSVIDAVVVVEADPTTSTPTTSTPSGRLDLLDGIARFAALLHDQGASGPLAASLTAAVMSGARAWTVGGSVPSEVARSISVLPIRTERHLIVAECSNVPGSAVSVLRLYDEDGPGAVVIDSDSGAVELLLSVDASSDDASTRPAGPVGLGKWAVSVADSMAVGHESATGSPTAVTGLLANLLGADEDMSAQPLVLGEVVLAHDSAFPMESFRGDRLDLLVDERQAADMAAKLDACGCIETGSGPAGTSGEDGVGVARWSCPDCAVTVVLHRCLATGPFGELVDHDELLARSVPVRIGARWYRALHPEDRFVHAALVAAANPDDEASLRAVAMMAPVDQVLATSVVEAAERWGAIRDVLTVVGIVERRFGGLNPWLVERAGRESPRRRGVRRRARRQ